MQTDLPRRTPPLLRRQDAAGRRSNPYSTEGAVKTRDPFGSDPFGSDPFGVLTPLGLTPLGLTPLGLTPLGLTPLGQTPSDRCCLRGVLPLAPDDSAHSYAPASCRRPLLMTWIMLFMAAPSVLQRQRS